MTSPFLVGFGLMGLVGGVLGSLSARVWLGPRLGVGSLQGVRSFTHHLGLLVASFVIGTFSGYGLHGPSRPHPVEAPAAKWAQAAATLVAVGGAVLD